MLVTLLSSLITLAPPTPADIAARVDAERLMSTLRSLPVSRAVRGDAASHAGLLACEDVVLDALRAMGDTPTTEAVRWAEPKRPADGVPPPEWRNIIVDRLGTAWPQEIVLIACHTDAVPGSPGADDNGTGVAALIELARVTRDVPTDRTMRFIFFAAEEVGLVGSSQYVKGRRQHLDVGDASDPIDSGKERIVWMVSLEMLGYFTDAPASQRSPIPSIPGVFEPPTVGDFISLATIKPFSEPAQRFASAMIVASPGLKVFTFDVLPAPIPDLFRSDHAPFMLASIPSAMLTDTSNFRNPHYHRATDTVDTIDAERFAAVVRGVVGGTLEIAGITAPAIDASPVPDR